MGFKGVVPPSKTLVPGPRASPWRTSTPEGEWWKTRSATAPWLPRAPWMGSGITCPRRGPFGISGTPLQGPALPAAANTGTGNALPPPPRAGAVAPPRSDAGKGGAGHGGPLLWDRMHPCPLDKGDSYLLGTAPAQTPATQLLPQAPPSAGRSPWTLWTPSSYTDKQTTLPRGATHLPGLGRREPCTPTVSTYGPCMAEPCGREPRLTPLSWSRRFSTSVWQQESPRLTSWSPEFKQCDLFFNVKTIYMSGKACDHASFYGPVGGSTSTLQKTSQSLWEKVNLYCRKSTFWPFEGLKRGMPAPATDAGSAAGQWQARAATAASLFFIKKKRCLGRSTLCLGALSRITMHGMVLLMPLASRQAGRRRFTSPSHCDHVAVVWFFFAAW